MEIVNPKTLKQKIEKHPLTEKGVEFLREILKPEENSRVLPELRKFLEDEVLNEKLKESQKIEIKDKEDSKKAYKEVKNIEKGDYVIITRKKTLISALEKIFNKNEYRYLFIEMMKYDKVENIPQGIKQKIREAVTDLNGLNLTIRPKMRDGSDKDEDINYLRKRHIKNVESIAKNYDDWKKKLIYQPPSKIEFYRKKENLTEYEKIVFKTIIKLKEKNYTITDIDDYLLKPKNNNYTSFHIKCKNEKNENIEIQIRTQEMHLNAESKTQEQEHEKIKIIRKESVLKKYEIIGKIIGINFSEIGKLKLREQKLFLNSPNFKKTMNEIQLYEQMLNKPPEGIAYIDRIHKVFKLLKDNPQSYLLTKIVKGDNIAEIKKNKNRITPFLEKKFNLNSKEVKRISDIFKLVKIKKPPQDGKSE